MDIRSLIESAVDFLFPRVCHICGNTLGDGVRYICPSCRQQLPRSLYHLTASNPMEQRFAGRFRFVNATAHFLYSGGTPLSDIIHDMKYRHFRGLGWELGKIMGRELYTTHIFSGIDMIVPIPMHFWKKARRGYNQAEDIADGVSEITGIGVGRILKAKKPHRTQTSLTHMKRMENLKGVFRIDNPAEIEGKHILLLDDVCTTGATLTEAAKTVIAASPSTSISILALASTY